MKSRCTLRDTEKKTRRGYRQNDVIRSVILYNHQGSQIKYVTYEQFHACSRCQIRKQPHTMWNFPSIIYFQFLLSLYSSIHPPTRSYSIQSFPSTWTFFVCNFTLHQVSARRKTSKYKERKRCENANIHGPNGIRTHDPSIPAVRQYTT